MYQKETSSRRENDEDDALGFIQDTIDDLYIGNTLENVYSSVDHPRVSMETLKPYWDRGRNFKRAISENA